MQKQIIAVQRMQDYIEKYLNETITLADLANVSLFSPWYSYRLFKEYTNFTPADYIQEAIRKYNPEIMGYKWDVTNPKIQLEPIGKRGYVEMVPVKVMLMFRFIHQ